MQTAQNSQRSPSPIGLQSPIGLPRRLEHSATEAAARLMSETAHDLRAPLTTIRESVRLVRDGDLGEVPPGQRICLDSAMDQCDCMEQMISEMVQVERLRSGMPRVHRHWVSIQTVRESIDDTLRPWVMPRQIEVLWGGVDDPNVRIFADPAMLRRLIVNLVTNAMRVTRERGQIMIRCKFIDPQTLQWSVIDHGPGLNQQALDQIANRQVSFSGGEGLGLSICRQLAAVHFSRLTIQSRIGIGTEVHFQTAAAGPRSVAELWSRWRVSQLDGESGSHPRGTLSSEFRSDLRQRRHVRLDPPACRVELAHEAVRPRVPNQLAAGVVTVGATVNREAADQFDKLLQGQCFLFDLVYRIDARRWVWVMDADQDSVQQRIHSINAAALAASNPLRIDWSQQQMIPVDPRRTAKRLSDLLVRESLYAAASAHIIDNNEVRLGTKPIEASGVAANRLDQELARLAHNMKSQTGSVQQLAQRLKMK